MTITRPFYLSRTEVTQKHFEAVMGTSWTNSIRAGKTPDHPVGVMGRIAEDYVDKLSKRAVEAAAGRIYRLPSEAEWEYACRAGSATAYHFGDDPSKLTEYDWYVANSDYEPHRVGGKKPNAWNLYDMHGNCREWCLDKYAINPQEHVVDPLNPRSGFVSICVVRGGSYVTPPSQCRSAWRFRCGTRTLYSEGFAMRIALSASVAPASAKNSSEQKAPDSVALIDSDRRAAEWVLSIGGTVSVLVEGTCRRVTSIQDLPVNASRS